MLTVPTSAVTTPPPAEVHTQAAGYIHGKGGKLHAYAAVRGKRGRLVQRKVSVSLARVQGRNAQHSCLRGVGRQFVHAPHHGARILRLGPAHAGLLYAQHGELRAQNIPHHHVACASFQQFARQRLKGLFQL